MSQKNIGAPLVGTRPSSVTDARPLQRAAVSSAPTSGVPPIVHDVLNSPGQSLDAGTRAFIEPRFGHDFSGVRIHTDTRAAESAKAVNALAYTFGKDVVFGRGQYMPETNKGRKLLAHELTHVIQQRGIVNTSPNNLKLSLSDTAHEREAEEIAESVQTETTASGSLSRSMGVVATYAPVIHRFEASEHMRFGDQTIGALSSITETLSSAETLLRRGKSAWRELSLVRDRWRQIGDPSVLRLLEQSTWADVEGHYDIALQFLERATPQVMVWLQAHPETGGGPTDVIAGHKHPEVAGLITTDVMKPAGPLILRHSGLQVTYGEVIALGDFYPSPEAMHKAPREELTNPKGKGVLDLIRAESASHHDSSFDQAYQEATQWREVARYDNLGRFIEQAGKAVGGKSFAKLAEDGREHFAGENRRVWEMHHINALKSASHAHSERDAAKRSVYVNDAYTVNAFGDHFLTDAFSAGHMLSNVNYKRLAGEFWEKHEEEALEAFTMALLNDHKGEVIKIVAHSIGIPILGLPLAALITFVAPSFIRKKIKAKIKKLGEENKDLIPNAAVKVAHDYYNAQGIEVHNSKGDRWRTFGDDHLNKSAVTWQIASFAVLRSRTDVTETLRGTPPADKFEAWKYTPIPPASFDTTALAQAASLILRQHNNPLADILIRNLPLIERIQEFEEEERERKQEAAGREKRVGSYLQHIRTTGRIEDRNDSDDIARAIVANPVAYGTLTLQEKGTLVQEMLSGYTGSDDERGILTILQDVQRRGELRSLLQKVPASRLKSKIGGDNYRQLLVILAREGLPTR